MTPKTGYVVEPLDPKGAGRIACPPLCVEMGFYGDVSWESRCNIEKNVWAHFYKILLVFEVLHWPESYNYKKLAKDASNIAFFMVPHWWHRLCETDWLGVGKNINEILKFYKNELRL